MSGEALGISGRMLEGQALTAATVGAVTGLQWQVLSNGQWVNVGTAGSATYTLPSGSSGKSYRITGSAAGATLVSDATPAVKKDTGSARTPVISGGLLTSNATEQAAPLAVLAPLAVTDADNTNFNGGSLTVLNSNALSRGGDGLDMLSVLTGTGQGQFSYNAATRALSYGLSSNGSHTVIGTVDAARTGVGTDFSVTFNSSATKTVVDALVNRIAFQSNDDSPLASRLLTLRVTDSTARVAQQSHIVNVAAVNDLPVFTGTASVYAAENQTAVATLAATDADSPTEPLTFALVAGAGDTHNQLFTLDSGTGVLQYKTAPDFEATSGTHAIRVRVTDSAGGATERNYTVAVQNVNEAPVAQALAASIGEDATAPVQLQASFTDPEGATGLALTFNASTTVGTVSLNGTTFAYTPSPSFNALAAGQTLVDQFAYTVTDPGGLSSTQTARITIIGANDVPTIGGSSTASIDLATGPGTPLRASGALTIVDPDLYESSFVGVTAARGPANLGTFTVSEDGRWNWEVYAFDEGIKAIPAGQVFEDRYTVTSQDGSASRDIVVQITGVNEPATFQMIQDRPLVEDQPDPDGKLRTSGRVVVVDPDTGESLLAGPTTQHYMLGTFNMDAQGIWTYEVDAAAPQMQWVSGESFEVTSVDGTQAWVTVGFTPVPDAPIITASGAGAVIEAGHLDDGTPIAGADIASGQLVATDADTYSGNSVWVRWSGSRAGTYGDFTIDTRTGAWSYQLDNSRPATQALVEGQQVSEAFDVTVRDDTYLTDTDQVVITILGTNDKPVIQASGTTGEVSEAAPQVPATGQLQASDPDGTFVVFGAQSILGQFGTFSLDTAGAWTYLVDAGDPDTIALAQGQVGVDTFPVSVQDQLGALGAAQVTVNVLGA